MGGAERLGAMGDLGELGAVVVEERCYVCEGFPGWDCEYTRNLVLIVRETLYCLHLQGLDYEEECPAMAAHHLQ